METNREYILANNALQLSWLMRLLMYVGMLPDKFRFPLLTQIFRQGNQVATKVEQGQVVIEKTVPASFFDVKLAVKKMDTTKYWLYLFKAVAIVVTAIIIYYK